MGSVATSTLSNPLGIAPISQIERQPSGLLWVALITNTATGVNYYRSADKGANWTLAGTWTLATTIQETSGLYIGNDGALTIAYRTNESSQDRIWLRRCKGTATAFSAGTPLLMASPSNSGTPGSVHTGLDLQVIGFPTEGTARVIVAAATVVASRTGVTLYGANVSTTDVLTSYNAVITGTRQWLTPNTSPGRNTPSLDIEHIGDGKTASTPHLWLTFGHNYLNVVKLAFTGRTWTGPTSTVQLKPLMAAPQDTVSGRWDGHRFLVAVPNPDLGGVADTVAVLERNQANSSTVQRTSPEHPTGVVRNCEIACNSDSGDFRVYAVGTSSTVLYYVDFIRASATWTGWTTVTATAILGTAGQNYSVRHESYGSARYDVLTAHAGAPNTIVSTSQVLTYAPNTPPWVFGSTANSPTANGVAVNVGAPLDLVWAFADPDPADAQTAWALSRQIGAGTIQYLRASDSTWQAAEQKNSGATASRTLAAAWAVHTDDPYMFKVKVWDGSDTASLYSEGLVVVPSTPLNPTITVPAADGAIWTTDTVTISWTVAEQSAYRVQLDTAGTVLHDSGLLGGTVTTYTIPTPVADGLSYSIRLYTYNDELLSSAQVTRTITVDYIEPAIPTLVATPQPTLGLIRVVITNPTPSGGQPALLGVDLMRRNAGSGSDTSTDVTIAKGLGVNATFDDWTARSGQAYEYRALARGANGTTGYGAWTA